MLSMCPGHTMPYCVQIQNAVTAYFVSKQLAHFGFHGGKSSSDHGLRESSPDVASILAHRSKRQANIETASVQRFQLADKMLNHFNNYIPFRHPANTRR